ncbi:MAG TPA: DUF4328 domain-containing protein [Candidatus Dormibacteraeota bacterium]|jgi:hypothetical protein|nr:DUF4328 domain-containing protein [Candidatus Dormibacteraeota bacterium]
MDETLPAYTGGAIPQASPDSAGTSHAGLVSADGLWRWDGAQWVPQAPTGADLNGYRSPRLRSRLAIAGLALSGVATLVALISEVGRLSIVNKLMSGESVTPDDATASDNLVRVGAIADVAMFVVCAAVFLAWLARIVANNHALGARVLRFSPRGAVGWWFVPFVNLVRPFQIVAESWRAADPRTPESLPDQRTSMRLPALIGAWWGTYLVANLVARSGSAKGADTLDALQGATVLSIASDVLFLVAAGLAAAVVVRLTRRQEEQHTVVIPRSAEATVA